MHRIRRAESKDIADMIRIRKQQLIDEGIAPDKDIDEALLTFFEEQLKNDTMVQFLLVEDEQIMATSAVCFYHYPPTYTNATGHIAYITNMYTHPDVRGKGIGTKMLDLAVEEARHRHVEMIRLGASRLGRSVYTAYGFQQDKEWMSLRIEDVPMKLLDK